VSKEQIEGRKEDHIRICLEEPVDNINKTDLSDFLLEYDALPEVDLNDIDLGCEVLGKKLNAPILIGAITGGTKRASIINSNLALAAEKLGIGLCLGSQRAMIEAPDSAGSFDVRQHCPNIPLVIGNMGAVQLNLGVTPEKINEGVSGLGLDGVLLHINPLQEAIQPEGDTQFKGLSEKIGEMAERLDFPCLVKEVGMGISAKTARKLASLPLDGVETAGMGGTSWTLVEAFRSGESAKGIAGRDLASFGVTTARSIMACRKAFGDRLVIGSGGIRTGYDAAVALALGADAVAVARPVLRAALESDNAVVGVLEGIIEGLRVTMFGCGCTKLSDLRQVGFLEKPAWSLDERCE